MGYGSIVYGNRAMSYITPKECTFLDRLFSKALIRTGFGRQQKERIDEMLRSGQEAIVTLEGTDIDRFCGAEALYQQTGLYFFGDNEFAFRNFSDTEEYRMPLAIIDKLPLIQPSTKILERLPEAVDKDLVEIEGRCTPSATKPDDVYERAEFMDGAWQLYDQLRSLAPDVLPVTRNREFIRRAFERRQKNREQTQSDFSEIYKYKTEEENLSKLKI